MSTPSIKGSTLVTSSIIATLSLLLSIGLLAFAPAPADAAGKMPAWQLPFEYGQSWRANGPHHMNGDYGPASSWSSLDFGPNAGSNGRVVAAAAGKVYKQTCSNGGSYLGIDHGNGWKSTYYHLKNEQYGLVGKQVAAGTYLGDASTRIPCGGSAAGFNHVHFSILRDGNPFNINGIQIGQYRVRTGSGAYLGQWTDLTGKVIIKVPASGFASGSLVSTTNPPKSLTATPKPTAKASAGAPGKLTATIGTWKPAPVSLSYQWQRGGQNISKATGTSYSMTSADYGKTIRLRVTGAKAGYATKNTYSKNFFAAKVTSRPGYSYVNLRSSATPNSKQVARVYSGKMIALECYVRGPSVKGPYGNSTLWYKVPGVGWASDALLETNTNSAVTPAC